MTTTDPHARFVPIKRLIASIDLAGFARAFQTHDDASMAAVLEDYYARCDVRLSAAQGTIVKFMGDGCLAVFPPNAVVEALGAIIALSADVEQIAARHGVGFELGAALHLAPVIEGEFGSGSSRSYDVVGRGVNQTFLIGRGAGIRISEPVYRSLPSAARSAWNKHKPPAIYHLADPGEILGGLGKDAATNAARW